MAPSPIAMPSPKELCLIAKSVTRVPAPVALTAAPEVPSP